MRLRLPTPGALGTNDKAIDGGHDRSSSVRRRSIRELSTAALALVLLTEAAAVGLLAVGLIGHGLPSLIELRIAGTLSFLGIMHSEIALRIEQARRRIPNGSQIDLTSVWTVGAALLLPAPYGAIVAALILAHLGWRVWRFRVPVHRQAFSMATVVLACLASSALLDRLGGLPESSATRELAVLALVVLVYTSVNSALISGVIAVNTPGVGVANILGSWRENVMEVGTVCLGALVAVAMTVNEYLVVLVLPPLLVIHRSVLIRELEEDASRDSKTGLLNAAAWHKQAERALRRSTRGGDPRGVLVLDLDHFKSVNDTHGHLAGDHVLAAVADAVRGEVRDRDLVGRFGGEEFVVLLAGLHGRGADELEAVAERIRRRVAGLEVQISTPDGPLTVEGLSVSVGAAWHSGDGGDLRVLLQVADAALYAAKRAGRNMVRVGAVLPAEAG